MAEKKPAYDTKGAAQIIERVVEERGWPPRDESANQRDVAARALLDAVEKAASSLKPVRQADELYLSGTPIAGQNMVKLVLTVNPGAGPALARVQSAGLPPVPVPLPTVVFDPVEGRFVGRTDAAIVIADAIAKAIFGQGE
jgi:hypothetical protein